MIGGPMPSYVCSVCHQRKEGTPRGGFNTIHGEAVTCSDACFLEGIRGGRPVTADAMVAALTRDRAMGHKPD
jgi:hypothetical protein